MMVVSAGDGDVFDGMDVKAILSDREKLLKAYNCLMDRGPCGEFQAIRDRAPKILKNRCADCTPSQKAKFNELKTRLRSEHGANYNEMIAKYAKSK